MRPRQHFHLLLALAAVSVFAAAACYATIGQTSPPAAADQSAVWLKVVAVTTTALSKAAAEGVHDAVIAAVEGSAQSATRTTGHLARRSARPDRSQRDSGCPLCRAGIKICPKRAGSGA